MVSLDYLSVVGKYRRDGSKFLKKIYKEGCYSSNL
jgi:hypothetical protein